MNEKEKRFKKLCRDQDHYFKSKFKEIFCMKAAPRVQVDWMEYCNDSARGRRVMNPIAAKKKGGCTNDF